MRYVVVICLLLAACSKTAPTASPTASLSANPASVEHGQCATLTWSSKDASEVTIDQQVGKVEASGTKEVCPLSDTQYTITASGAGGSATASTTVGVSALAAANVMIFPEAALFDLGKAELKPEGKQKIDEYRQQAQAALSSAEHVKITGYTDNVGGADRNAALSLHRAEAVRDHLVSVGADPQKFEVNGAGPDHPIGDNSTEEGRAQNRRVEVAVVGAEK
ncbi:MAG: OmpA family protein [Povalibacter sp.]|jgi:peptidoglycan-associated lipoprotein